MTLLENKSQVLNWYFKEFAEDIQKFVNDVQNYGEPGLILARYEVCVQKKQQIDLMWTDVVIALEEQKEKWKRIRQNAGE